MKTREQLELTGNKILGQVRTELYLSMRFFGPALGSLDFTMDLSTRTLGTDAAFIRFNPTYVLQTYLEDSGRLNRAYMHMLMHCLFRHMFFAKNYADAELWDLCCDIAAESVVDAMDYPVLARVTSDLRQEWYARLQKELPVLTAQKLYQYFMLHKRDPYLEETLRQEFALCDHSFWKRLSDEPEKQSPPEPQTSAADGGSPQEQPSSVTPLGSANPKENEWKERAKRLESEMEFAKDAAADTGSLSWLLQLSVRERKSYKEYLKRFAVLREEIRTDLDSFDYGFYMYGLTHYGNLPLIEENEFCESKKIEELVIAIDTSASCKKELVQQFLNETGAILRQQASFFKRVHIRILECDDQIQDELVITDLDELDHYAKRFTVRGGYGTDFRPVFSHVETLRRKGQLRQLKGLLYFTDGFGTYPKKPTDYETVFVFYGEKERDLTQVPDWALTLYLEETHEH